MSITIKNLEKKFSEFTALNGVDLEVKSGELLALLGPSGSGKTTLLRIIAGLDTPTGGELQFHGADAVNTHARERGIGFVFQHYALFRHMTIFENIAYGLRVKPKKVRPSKQEISDKVHELLRLIQLENLGSRYPSELSGGQRQRVALARALAVEPRFLLLDEPFGALDAQVREELRRWLRRLHDQLGLTSVFVTHDQEEALELADRVVILNKGKVEQIGTPEQVVTEPKTEFVSAFLGNGNRFEGKIEDGHFVIGDQVKWPLFRSIPEEGELVAGFVRPWEFKITRDYGFTSDLAVKIRHRYIAGSKIRLELERLDGAGHVKVELSPEKCREFQLEVGETIGILPQSIQLFRQNGKLIPEIPAELNWSI